MGVKYEKSTFMIFLVATHESKAWHGMNKMQQQHNNSNNNNNNNNNTESPLFSIFGGLLEFLSLMTAQFELCILGGGWGCELRREREITGKRE